MLFALAAASVFVVLSGSHDGAVRVAAVPLAATYAYVGLANWRAARLP
jgi:hypothetical protein